MPSSSPKSPLTFLRPLISFLIIGTSLICLQGLFCLQASSIYYNRSWRRKFASSVTFVMLLFSLISMSRASPPSCSIKFPFRFSESRFLTSFKQLASSTAALSQIQLLLRSNDLRGIYLLHKSDEQMSVSYEPVMSFPRKTKVSKFLISYIPSPIALIVF